MERITINGKCIKVRQKRTRLNLVTSIMLVGLVLWVTLFFTIIFWSIITSFKAQSDFRINILGLPKKWVWNIGVVFRLFKLSVTNPDNTTVEVGYFTLFGYSLLYSVGSALAHTVVLSITAYCCARFRYKYSTIVVSVVIAAMIIPIVGTNASQLQLMHRIGFYDRMWAMWVMAANCMGLYFLVALNIFKALPYGYTEAAKVDGAGNFTIMLRIVFPLVKGTLFTIFLLDFVANWNNYQTPLLYMPRYPTVSLALYRMATTLENNMSSVPMRLAASMCVFLPIFVLFLIFNKRMMGNLTMGGLKG